MPKKELGQYFSGNTVSELLSSIIPHGNYSLAIDPMVGRGDLLKPLLSIGLAPENLFGIDIDGDALAQKDSLLGDANLYEGDAFSREWLPLYRGHQWDLVVTNPPYVRRQRGELGRAAADLRNKLLSVLEGLGYTEDSGVVTAARSYPGTSDLSIPSWILCAALVRPGGILAMVAPDAWLTRNYARSIRRLINDEFELERLVIDGGRSWFDSAQVKTDLLIARRRKPGVVANGNTRIVELDRSAEGEGSLVGNVSYGEESSYDALNTILRSDENIDVCGLRARSVPQAEVLGFDVAPVPGWSDRNAVCPTDTCTLKEWGVEVGQGFRSGANDFFYLNMTHEGRYHNKLIASWFSDGQISIPEDFVMKALRRQSQLGDSFVIEEASLASYVLVVPRLALDELTLKSKDLVSYIIRAEQEPLSINGRPRLVPELSAVAPNGGYSTDPGPRHWFNLPPMADRHVPEIVIPRVVGGRTCAYLMPKGRRVIADANFCTIWRSIHCEASSYAVLAILNSLPFQYQIETNSPVLGGGALKCEATLLKRILIPKYSAKLAAQLDDLGRRLSKGDSSAQESIDAVMLSSMFSETDAAAIGQEYQSYLTHRVAMRAN